MTIEYLSFVCFVGTPSWSFCFIIFFIHEIIISYPNDKMDKRFSRNRLRDLLWMERAWYSIAPIFLFSSFFFFPELAEINHFLLAHIPRMNESHDPGRPFKVAITTSAFWIVTFFNCFLKAIFWFKFLSSNSLVKESNIFSVFWDTLVVQVDSWLNQQWSSWPWPSSSCVRLLASSPSGIGTSILM